MHPCLLAVCLLAAAGQTSPLDARGLAARIDRRIEERLRAEHVQPVERAEDAEFLRRLSLDLVGHIPTTTDVQSFLQDARPDKRSRLIDRLLADPQHAAHFARIWRELLLPEATTDRFMAYFQSGLEAWLAQRRQRNEGFGTIVHELIAPMIPVPNQPPRFVLSNLREPNPLAFLASSCVDFGQEPGGPVRAHEIRFPGGDCTSDIWI